MKTLHNLILFAGILFVFCACNGKRYNITTEIFPDGSCERIMQLRTDSSNLKENNYFIPIDSTWQRTLEFEWDSAQKKNFAMITVHKNYPTVKAMSQEFFREPDTIAEVNIRMKLKRTFLWFYTKYRYEETFTQFFPFHHYPINDYLTDQEIAVSLFDDPVEDSLYYLGADSLERKKMEENIEQRLDTFIRKNVFREFYHSLETAIQNTKPQYFTDHPLQDQKEEMYSLLDDFSQLGEDNLDISAQRALEKIDSLYRTSSYSMVYESDSAAFKEYNRKIAIDYMIDEKYEYELIMPGTLLNSNSPDFKDGNPHWQFEYVHYLLKDYILWAESKKGNNWAFWVTVLVIIMAFGLLFLRKNPK